MPRTSERGGPQTRERIREVANRMFLERGFDAVTVAEIAGEAGVSSVTVFKHFPRKEDLFLDRAVDAMDLLRAAVRERPANADVVASLRGLTLGLIDRGEPLSGVDPRSMPFFRTVAESAALTARAREISSHLQGALADELRRDPAFVGDAELFAAFFIAGYASVLVRTARRLLAGEAVGELVDDHRARFERLFLALRRGVIDLPADGEPTKF